MVIYGFEMKEASEFKSIGLGKTDITTGGGEGHEN
jgi:hypothetical protein